VSRIALLLSIEHRREVRHDLAERDEIRAFQRSAHPSAGRHEKIVIPSEPSQSGSRPTRESERVIPIAAILSGGKAPRARARLNAVYKPREEIIPRSIENSERMQIAAIADAILLPIDLENVWKRQKTTRDHASLNVRESRGRKTANEDISRYRLQSRSKRAELACNDVVSSDCSATVNGRPFPKNRGYPAFSSRSADLGTS